MSEKKFKKKRSESSEPTRKGRSWWSNGGMFPVPAVNTGRPFDFQVGNPTGQFVTNPYAFGNAQYIVNSWKIPDNWYACSAFDTVASKLYQSIRENLRSNLAYYEPELKAYLANVMFLQAACSTIERDFKFMKFRDPQHPTFEDVWGNQVASREYQFDNPSEPDVKVSQISKKVYLTKGDYAENLTYLETVIIPKLSLIVVPPAMAEFMKWMFGNVFVDESNPAHAQFYWNELNSLPYFNYDSGSQTISVAGTYDISSISLDMVAQMITTIASEYGIIIADLKRAQAQMVTLTLEKPSDTVSLRYDEVFFAMLRNAYTACYRTTSSGSLTEAKQPFFLVDFVDGMNSDQMCTALFGAGALIDASSVMVHPMVLTSQSVIVKLDRSTNLVLGAITVSSDGTVTKPAAYPEGVYTLTYTSNVGGYVQRDSTGWIAKATSFAVSSTAFVGNGSANVTADAILANCDTSAITRVNIPIGYGYVSGAHKVLYARLQGTSTFSKVKVGGCFKYSVTGSGACNWLGINSSVTFSDGSDTSFTNVASAAGTSPVVNYSIVWYTPDDNFWTSVRPDLQKNLYKGQISYSVSSPGDGFTVSTALSDVSAFGDVVIGEQQNTATAVMLDASNALHQWLAQEVDYHVPMWSAQLIYDVDTATPEMVWPQLEKETEVSTSYNTTELEALLYQLYYSLYFVHAVNRVTKKA